MADLIPDEAVQPLATFLWGKDLQPEYPAGAEAHAVARALLAKCAPHILAAELDRWAEHCEAEAAKYAHLGSDHGRKFAAAHALRNLADHHLRPRAALWRGVSATCARLATPNARRGSR